MKEIKREEEKISRAQTYADDACMCAVKSVFQ